MYSNMVLTTFHIEKSKSIVGTGDIAAYQICTIPGEPLGRLGAVVESDTLAAANDNHADSTEPAVEATAKPTGWFNRLLAALRN